MSRVSVVIYFFFRSHTILSGKAANEYSRAITTENLYSCRRFPSTLANLSKLDAYIKDGTAMITANVKLLNAVIFVLMTIISNIQLSVYPHESFHESLLLLKRRIN